jgi:G:T-mismatch repair DNA endonuclease (very short patch repair protein)
MLGRMPGDDTWAALETAAGRVARDMNSQGLANTLHAYATLSTLRGVELPSCYAAVWDRVCGLEARDFSDEGLFMLFHAHLMHEYSDTCRSVKVAYPAWLMVEARDEWMRDVDARSHRSHQELARVFGELGVKHQEERVTDDGYFSMDIYLPEYDVAVEFDGPTHYYHNSTDSSSTSRDASMTKTAKTELRDIFLAKQCAKVVTVPGFEWRRLNTPEKKRLYVKENGEGGRGYCRG